MTATRPPKILQVCNVSSMTGGTGRCAFDIAQSFPDCQNHIHAMSGNRMSAEVMKTFCHDRGFAFSHGGVDQILTADHDLMILHNSRWNQIGMMPLDRAVYLWHSGGGCAKTSAKCRSAIANSKWLRDRIDPALEFIHQPVSVPEGQRQTGKRTILRIGRIATPGNRHKWKANEIIPIYQKIRRLNRPMLWEFVGCPSWLETELRFIHSGVKFYQASVLAQEHFWNWDVMLYTSTLAESYGRTVAEAQMCGCIPIVPDRGGFSEQIRNGVDGFLCVGSDEYYNAVRECFNLKNGRNDRMVTAAMESGRERSGLRSFRSRFLKLLEGLNYETFDSCRSDVALRGDI